MKWVEILETPPRARTCAPANDQPPLSRFDRMMLAAWPYLPHACLAAAVLGFVAGVEVRS